MIIILLAFLFTTNLYAQAPVTELKDQYTKQEIQTLIHKFAKQYGVSETVMNHIVSKESGYNQYALHKNDGKTGCDSRGLAQLNSCYMGKDIPDSLAYHPPYAIDKLAYELKNGQCKQWSTCPTKNTYQ